MQYNNGRSLNNHVFFIFISKGRNAVKICVWCKEGAGRYRKIKNEKSERSSKKYVVFKALCQMAQLLLKATFFLSRYYIDRTVHDTHLSYLFIFLCLDELSWLLIVRPPLPCATTKRQHVDS